MAKNPAVCRSRNYPVGWGVGYLAIEPVLDTDSRPLFAAKLISKSLIMSGLHAIERVSKSDYVPTPLDPGQFRYADLTHENFANVRTDSRLAKLYHNADSQWDFDRAVRAADFLWAHLPQGTSSRDWQQNNVPEMFEAAANGELFLCWDISRMLLELVQVGGLQGRLIGLSRDDGGGHVVTEIWSERYEKWFLIDATNNVYYQHGGKPLNAWDNEPPCAEKGDCRPNSSSIWTISI